MSNEIQPQPSPLANPTATGVTPSAQANNGREAQWAGGLTEYDEKLAQNSIGETKSTLPQVIIPGGSMSNNISSESLFKVIALSKELFYRGGVVVDLHRNGAEYESKVLNAVTAQSRFEKYVQFVKPNKQGSDYIPTIISKSQAEVYLNSAACENSLPKLNGILYCPLLVEKDGKLHRAEQGYDETTGYIIANSQQVEKMSLSEAVNVLNQILQDFKFVTFGDRSRAFASLITPALKFGGLLKDAVPVDVAEANASQSGKTFRQKLVAALYNQKLSVVTKKNGGVGSSDETFGACLIKGNAFIQFDNVRGKFDSQYLESFITADGLFPARIPYGGTVMVDPSKFILFMTSNGFEATQDLTNRASIIRIRKREGVNYFAYQGLSIKDLIFQMQPLFTGALFTIVEEWHRQGKPITGETRHDFREWCQSLDWIVQNIFKEAPLMDGHAEAKQRAMSPQLSFLRLVAEKLRDNQKLGQRQTASDIAQLAIDSGIEIPGLAKDKQDIDGGRKQIGVIMSKLFDGKLELTFEEIKVTKEEETGRSEAGYNKEVKYYTFNLVSAAMILTAKSNGKP